MVSFQSKMLSETVSCCAGPTVFWHQDIDTMHTHTQMHIDRLSEKKKKIWRNRKEIQMIQEPNEHTEWASSRAFTEKQFNGR